jgi:hypothetical protein
MIRDESLVGKNKLKIKKLIDELRETVHPSVDPIGRKKHVLELIDRIESDVMYGTVDYVLEGCDAVPPGMDNGICGALGVQGYEGP